MAAGAASAGSCSDAGNREQRQPDTDRRRLAAGDPVDAVHEIVEIDEPDPEQRRRRPVERGGQPSLKHRTFRQRATTPRATAAHCAPNRTAGDRPRRSSSQEISSEHGGPGDHGKQRRRRRPRRDQDEPGRERRRDNGDAAAARRRYCMRRALVRPVEHRRPPQQRDQRARAETGGDAGPDHHDCRNRGSHPPYAPTVEPVIPANGRGPSG